MSAIEEQRPSAGGAAGSAVLELRGVSKRFGGLTAVDNVSLHVGAGEVVALIGHNGAGKSTTVRMLSGVYPPDGGELRIEGQVHEFHSPADAREVGIETVYQELALVDDMSVYANICLGRESTTGWRSLSLMNRRAMRRRATEILASFGVKVGSVSGSVRNLSGGQRQAVALARAVGWGTRLVILDEPTAALGVRETEQVEQMIRSLPEAGVSVVIVSHSLEQLFRLTDRMYVFRRGEIVAEFATAGTTQDEVVDVMMRT